MIVNGTAEFLGSDRNKAHSAITKALRARPRASLKLSAKTTQEGVAVQYDVDGVLDGYALNFAVIQTPQSSDVTHGENAGRKLEHVNVVRAFRVIVPEQRSGTTTLELPSDLDDSPTQLVAYLQNKDSYSIVAANVTTVESGGPSLTSNLSKEFSSTPAEGLSKNTGLTANNGLRTP